MTLLCYLALIFWGFALINIVINLCFLGRLRHASLERHPFVSIIVPARNEERAIERSVRAFLAQQYPDFEVIVVDDRSTDTTAAILDRLATEDARLVVIRGVDTPAGWLGKPWALHQGSERARGELLLFVDADVHYAPATLAAAVAHMEATRHALIALMPHFECRSLWEHALMPGLPMSLFSVPTWLGELLPIESLGVGAGTGNLVRRDAYAAAGGHAALRDSVVDDVALAHLVRRSGFSTGIARTERLVTVRMYHGFGEIVGGFTKNFFSSVGRSYVIAFLVFFVFVDAHLLPIFFALAGNQIAIAAIVMLLITRVVFFAGLRYPLWNALLLDPLMAIGWIAIVIRSTWYVGIRRQLSWRGRTYDPARTRFGAER